MTKFLTSMDRFWRKVTELPNGCWERSGGGKRGYSYHWDGQKQVRAHRFAWAAVHGPIPEGKNVLHTCDNPPCIRVAHLYLGDQKQNMLDCKERQRFSDRRGFRNANARLTPKTLREIRKCLARKEFQYVIAEKFGVSEITINRINRGVLWASV